MVCTSPHWHSGDSMIFHLWSRKAQHPCPVRIRFNRSHIRRGKLKTATSAVGSFINCLLCTVTAFHQFFHRDFRSVWLSALRKKIQNGERDLSRKFGGAETRSLWMGSSVFSWIF